MRHVFQLKIATMWAPVHVKAQYWTLAMRHVFQLKRATMYICINTSIQCSSMYPCFGFFLSLLIRPCVPVRVKAELWTVAMRHVFQLKIASMYASINSSMQCNWVYLSLGVLFLSYTTMGHCSGQGWIVNTGHETCLPAQKGQYVCQNQQLNTMQFGVSKPWCFVPFWYDHGPLFRSRLNSERWPWHISSSWK
jgi:hypothetical protein